MSEYVCNMDEITKVLLAQFPDEINDSNMYYDLACKAANQCQCDKNLSHGLYEISRDEYTHAKFIHDYLIQHGHCMPEELKCKWEALQKRAEQVYPSVPKKPYHV